MAVITYELVLIQNMIAETGLSINGEGVRGRGGVSIIFALKLSKFVNVCEYPKDFSLQENRERIPLNDRC